MDSYSKLAWALEDHSFKELVVELVECIEGGHARKAIDPEIVNAALLFVNALFFEGSPYYAPDAKLKVAVNLSQLQTRLMFHHLRQMHKEIGMPVLIAMKMQGSIN